MLPLRHLRIVQAVVAGGGVRASSEGLLRAPSAVSRSVALLQSAVGVQLFEREGRGLLPTSAALRVDERFRRIEAELRGVLAECQPTATAFDALCDERRLQAAALLAELNHMPGVAARLSVTQPAISAAIARLESALRQPLFLRAARGLLPTDFGARALPRFERALAELRYLEDDLAALRGSVQGVVAVGALPLARTRVLPQAIAALHALHPQLRVRAIESPYEQLRADLLHGRIDFIVGALRHEAAGPLEDELLFAEPLRIVAAASHRLQGRRRVTLAQLRDEAWVLSRPGSPLRSALDDCFRHRGEPPPVPVLETGDLAMVRGMLLDGGMVTVLSAHQLRYELDAGLVRFLPVDLGGLEREIGFTTRRGAVLPAGVQALMGEIRTAVARLA